MDLYHLITATWIGAEDEPGASCVLKIRIDISKIQAAMGRFDLFTITKVATNYKDATNTWQEAEYEFTRIHRAINSKHIEFQVRIYGSVENLKIKSCKTKGYYVCKEE